MLRRSLVVESADRFAERPPTVDGHATLSAAARGAIAYTDEPLEFGRIHIIDVKVAGSKRSHEGSDDPVCVPGWKATSAERRRVGRCLLRCSKHS